jgi:hypothetical protein
MGDRTISVGEKPMTTFEIHFIWQGKAYQELITTTNTFRAKQLIRGRYPGARITSVRKV